MVRRFVLVLVATCFGGCGIYSVSGSLPAHIKTAAVPLFENETSEIGIVESLTDAIQNAVISDGSMKVVGEFQADAVVRGTIIDVVNQADEFTREERAETFRITIIAQVEFFDRAKNRVIWREERMEGWARYDAAGGSAEGVNSTREDAIEDAADMLAKEIIDKTVAGW